jgi:phosphatidylglycerophosphatase A
VVVCQPVGWLGEAVLTLIGLYLAFALCGEAEKRLAKVDPPEVNLDEFAVMPLVFFGLRDVLVAGPAWAVYVLGFAVFRIFDVAKPLGIARMQRFVGGAGVVLDDVAAALAACTVLHAVLRLTPLLAWAGGEP